MQRNLILGGSGLIGRELSRQLKELGEEVTNLDLKNGVDICSISLDEYANVDYVWFLAWDSGGAKYLANKENYLNIYKKNVMLCNTVFPFLERTKLPFLFTSSQLAATNNPYGFTKLLGEEWGSLLGGKIVRMWNVFGWEHPNERSHVIPDLVIQARTKHKISLMTSGAERRQFIFVEDCVRNLIDIRTREGSTFHLTDGHWMSILEIANILASMLDSTVETQTLVGYENFVDPDDSYKQFRFENSLHDGLRKVIAMGDAYLKTV